MTNGKSIRRSDPHLVEVVNESDIDRARHVLRLEADGLMMLAETLDDGFVKAIDLLQAATGRIVVTGMGKSGHIARKISSTLASTGVPSFYVHPGEASHGDLGMIDHSDAVIAISNSGETPELSNLVAYTRRFKIPLIAVTSRPGSTIAEQADVTLLLPPAEEACPIGLAPTTSTTMTLALGDAIAMALMDRLGFTADDFKIRHPGGQLGKRLLKVSDIMHSGAALPLASGELLMSDIIVQMTAKSFGCIAIVEPDNNLRGIITDGDLRRHMSEDILSRRAEEVMTEGPKTIRPSALASEAVQVMNEVKITNLFVLEERQVVGIIHIHDCLRAGVE